MNSPINTLNTAVVGSLSTPENYPDPLRLESEIAAFEAADALKFPAPGGIVFTGSSTITYWNENLAADFPGHNVIGRGFGGSTIVDGIHYLDRTVLPYRPRLVVFYAGENDMANGRTPEGVAADFAEFCARVMRALTDTRILYIAMKPSLCREREGLLPGFAKGNALIADYCSRTFRCAFFDMTLPMLDAAGKSRTELFTEDMLHMNAEGYRLWREHVAPLLDPQLLTIARLDERPDV